MKRLKNIVQRHPTNTTVDDCSALVDAIVSDVPEIEYEMRTMYKLGKMLPNTLKDPHPTVLTLFASDGIPAYFMTAFSTCFYYRAISNVLKKAVSDSLQYKKIVRILEVGSRMGGMSRFILEALHNEIKAFAVEYTYTDVDVTFFNHGKQNLHEYPEVKYQLLDLEKDIQNQDFVPHSYDIVVCLDTLHGVQNVHTGLRAMKNLLCENGWLVVMEPTNGHYLLEISFGALELCWVYKDHREECCWMNQEGWIEVFKQGGMENITCVSSPTEFFHSVIIGSNSGFDDEIASINYVLLAEGENTLKFATSLCTELNNRHNFSIKIKPHHNYRKC